MKMHETHCVITVSVGQLNNVSQYCVRAINVFGILAHLQYSKATSLLSCGSRIINSQWLVYAM